MKYCFGVDVGGTTVKIGLFQADGVLVDKWEIKTRTENKGCLLYTSDVSKRQVYTSTPRMELCVCSFKDTLTCAFTSRYDSLNIQRNFYEILENIGVSATVIEPEYPEDAQPNYEGRKFYKGFSFGCMVAAVFAVMANVIFSPEKLWSVFVSAGIFSMWATLSMGYVKRHNLLKNGMWQLLGVTIGCVLWDVCTGWRGWSVNYVLPVSYTHLSLSAADISMLTIPLA